MFKQLQQKDIFLNSVFFVLGFSAIFSIVGVLLQSALSSIGYQVQQWLGYIGGALIIAFGLYLVKVLKIPFLDQERKIAVKKRYRYQYMTSFVFGAAFAVGWTPCVGAILGAILTLAVVSPVQAFPLLFTYSLGLGIPFLLVGLFTEKSQQLIQKSGKVLTYFNYIFGILLIILGFLVFTNQLSQIASFPLLSGIELDFGRDAAAAGTVTYGFALIAGLASFLSPCVLPLIPAFLTYLASTVSNKHAQK